MATTSVSPAGGKYGLEDDEVRRFHEQGYLGPFRAFSEDEMAKLRAEVERVLATDAPATQDPTAYVDRAHNRHLDEPVVHQLATVPAVVERMKAILGPNLLLWRTNFFAKGPGGKEIPWHQDVNFWPIEPAVLISAWIAIDPATPENSCVQLIPGSHRHVVPHIKAGDEMEFEEEADPNHFDRGRAINMELKPGEFFLFTERTLHHSDANRSDRRRIGLSVRVIPPIARILDYDAPNHGVVLIAGYDDMGFNRTVQPPAE